MLQTIDAIKTMLVSSGMSTRKASLAMGRSNTYLSGILYRSSVPTMDTMAMLADACGHDLLLRNRSDGTEILIDPPSDDD